MRDLVPMVQYPIWAMEGLGEMAMHARFDAIEKRLEHPTWPARVDRLSGTPSLVTNRVSNSLIVRGITL